QMAQATATLGPTTGFIPITTRLEITLASASIVRATVGFLGAEGQIPSIYNNWLVIDDVEFDQGPPPPCLATQPPVLRLNSPQPGSIQTVQINEFILDYNVTTQDPFAQLTLNVTGP